ncbi:MAG: hypothetical protein ACLFVJ_22890 [Persicimonas sp.]
MAPSDRKAVLAIEWVWLLIGTGVVLAHLVEAWAAPHLPLVSMMAGLVLFVGYRFAAAMRHLYLPPKPAKPAQQPVGATLPSSAYEDDAPGTDYVVLPHLRGRRRRDSRRPRQDELAEADASDTHELPIGTGEAAPRPSRPPRPAPLFSDPEPDTQPDTQPDQKIAVPSADGAFYDDDLATVLADVEDNEQTLRVDKDELREETEADVTTSGITIPQFAESSLSVEERRQAMAIIHSQEEDPSRVETQPSVSIEEDDQ